MEKKQNGKAPYSKKGCLWMVVVVAILSLTFICAKECRTSSSGSGSTESERTELEGDLDYVEEYHFGKPVRKVIDRWSEDVILDNLTWLVYNEGDSLVAYAQQNRRGYLNLRTRKTSLLDEKYVKVYLYKEGRALVESLDSLYVLDTRQHVVARYLKTEERDTEVNYYHKGHLPMIGENGKLGLIDTCGVWSVAPQYDKVSWALEEFWLGITNPVMVDEETGQQTAPHRIVMDSQLRTIMEGDWTYLMVTRDGYITVADQNHWQWHYALDGTLIDDFVCSEVLQMSFTTGEKKWIKENDDVIVASVSRQVDVEETATLLKYVTSEKWEGLMTKDGKIITPPVFWNITAVSKNLYLCMYDTSSEHGILLNERGERVKR